MKKSSQKAPVSLTIAIGIGLVLGVVFGLLMPGRFDWALPVVYSIPTRSRLGFRVSPPGCHLAGQTSSPCS